MAALTPAKRQLLAEVAAAIIDSGYAVKCHRPYTPHGQRKQQIAALAEDARLFSCRRSEAARMLVQDVMSGCNVTHSGARVMIHQARELAQQKNGCGDSNVNS